MTPRARALLRLPIRLVKAVPFGLWFLWELLLANLFVAWEVVTPNYYMRSGIVRVPLRSHRAWEVVLVANLISLTPGTLTLEVAEDPWVLYVHALHLRPEGLGPRVRKLEDRLHWMVR